MKVQRSKKSRQQKDKSTTEKQKKLNKALKITIIITVPILLASIGTICLNNMTTTEISTHEEKIAYQITYINDDTLELGTETVRQTGAEGKKTIYIEKTKKLLNGTEVSRRKTGESTTKRPTEAIILRGTKRWQYMYCSDGSYRYYTNKQFTDSTTIGFTHSSPDSCAADGHGKMTKLADTPPATQQKSSTPTNSSYQDDTYGYQDYIPIHIHDTTSYDTSSNLNLNNSQATSNESSAQPDDTSTKHDDSDTTKTEQLKLAAKNACQSEANSARNSYLRQIGAMGAGGSAATSGAQNLYNSTYSKCMSRKGF